MGAEISSTVVFAVVADHQHDFPFENVVVVYETAGDSGDVLVGLHLFELLAQEGCGGGGGCGGAGHGGRLLCGAPRGDGTAEEKSQRGSDAKDEISKVLQGLARVLV